MSDRQDTRRRFIEQLGFGTAAAAFGRALPGAEGDPNETLSDSFLIRPSELTLKFRRKPANRRLSFMNYHGTADSWRVECRAKLAELLGIANPQASPVRELRKTSYQGVTIRALVMNVSDDFSIPAYPVFSDRVRKIFASGTLGSFSAIFSMCYNAPAHCIPGVLEWMDRSDIAGLNAPRPILIHYGERDTPGPQNHSAAYNPTVDPSMEELRAIYRAFDVEEMVTLLVTPNSGHEMDIGALLEYFS